MPEIGQLAPDFTAKDSQGNFVSLKDFAKGWLVLYFYPKDNTPGCTTEAKEFSLYRDRFEELDAKLVGISPDTESSHDKFINKHQLSIQLLSDQQHQICEAYQVWKLKKFMGKEYMGVVRSTFLIDPEGKIVEIWNKVRVKGHVEAVLNKLQECFSEHKIDN